MTQKNMLDCSDIPPHEETTPGSGEKSVEGEKVDYLEIAAHILNEKKIVLRFAFAAFAAMTLIAFLVLKPTYTATAMFIPPQGAPGSSLSQLTSQLGSFGSLGALSGLKSPGDIYVGILESRTIADGLIKRFDLQSVYKTKKLSDAEKTLKSNSTIVSGKDTLVTVSVEDHDPKRAADIANGYLEELRERNGYLALTESAQRRLFFEQQLEREKNSLADAEVELKRTQEQTGLIMPGGQAQVEIETIADLRAQITSREVALGALKQGATDQNPDVIRLQTEIAGLRAQLQKQQDSNVKHQPGNVQPPTAKVPEFALQYIRKQREVRYHELLFELIAKQYEAARLDEARESPVLQILDRAVVPDKKSGPPRLILMIAGFFLGGMIGLGWVVVRYILAKLEADPHRALKIAALKQAASLR